MRNKVKMVDMKTKITFYNVEKEKISFFWFLNNEVNRFFQRWLQRARLVKLVKASDLTNDGVDVLWVRLPSSPLRSLLFFILLVIIVYVDIFFF